MKTQINLRPPEFQKQNEFYLPRVIKIVFVFVIIAALGGCIFYVELNRADMAAEVFLLKTEVEPLENRVEELKEMEKVIADFKAARKLEEKILKERHYWTYYLQELDHKALGMVSLLQIESSENTKIFIRGEGEEMEMIASFAERVSNLYFIEKAELVYLERLEQAQYTFQITGEIINKGEPVEDAQV